MKIFQTISYTEIVDVFLCITRCKFKMQY